MSNLSPEQFSELQTLTASLDPDAVSAQGLGDRLKNVRRILDLILPAVGIPSGGLDRIWGIIELIGQLTGGSQD